LLPALEPIDVRTYDSIALTVSKAVCIAAIRRLEASRPTCGSLSGARPKRQSKSLETALQVVCKENEMPNTIRLHRVFRTTPEKLYRAFLEPEAMAKWLPPHGFTGKVDRADARVGGGYKMSFTNFTTGQSHSFGGSYVELVPHQIIRYTDKFDDPNLPGEMQVTIQLKKVAVGTEVNILQEGVPDVIPAEACYLGWQESLALLAQLVEPNITSPATD
jgi:uncharacterized protein YndB with AHSA1/START domain